MDLRGIFSTQSNPYLILCLPLHPPIHLAALAIVHLLFLYEIGSNNPTGISPVQFSSIAQSCPTCCDPMNRSTPGHPVHHQLPEFTQAHVHRVSDAI